MSDVTLFQVTTINRENGEVYLEALCLPGEVPATMTWHYGEDTTSIEDKAGQVFKVTIQSTGIVVA